MVDEQRIWLCNDIDFVAEYFGWVGDEDDSLDMGEVFNRYYDEHFISPEPTWKQVLERNATRIELWGGTIELTNEWSDGDNIIRAAAVVSSTEDNESIDLAEYLEAEFENALETDQTAFIKNNNLKRRN